jgi:hypothetical protein
MWLYIYTAVWRPCTKGPDKLVRDLVSLSGACSLGTEPFVPCLAYAAVGLCTLNQVDP